MFRDAQNITRVFSGENRACFSCSEGEGLTVPCAGQITISLHSQEDGTKVRQAIEATQNFGEVTCATSEKLRLPKVI